MKFNWYFMQDIFNILSCNRNSLELKHNQISNVYFDVNGFCFHPYYNCCKESTWECKWK